MDNMPSWCVHKISTQTLTQTHSLKRKSSKDFQERYPYIASFLAQDVDYRKAKMLVFFVALRAKYRIMYITKHQDN